LLVEVKSKAATTLNSQSTFSKPLFPTPNIKLLLSAKS
jgi:hypothetical protein